jgi:hypothetical protein
MSSIFKVFPKNDYKEIIGEIRPYHYYIYEKEERLPGNILPRTLPFSNYNCVVAGSGSALSCCVLKCSPRQEIVIPKDAQVIVTRLLRFDDTHEEPHYNANDQLIFPTISGQIFRLARNDAPDHFKKIIDKSNMSTIADAYQLPEAKYGPIAKYGEKGAKLYIELYPIKIYK